MSEELLQRDLIKHPEKIDEWNFYNIRSTTIKNLKQNKIIKNIDVLKEINQGNEKQQMRTQKKPRADAQTRSYYARNHARTGENRRRGGGLRRHGARTHSRGHPRGGRRVAHVRSEDDKGDSASGFHSRHGEVPHRAYRRSADFAGDRNRLYRRKRSFIPRGRPVSYRQNAVRRALRLRRARPQIGRAPV